jgi:twitching motility protein PilT
MEMIELLELALKRNASDLIITANSPPILRINGDVIQTELDKLSPKDTKSLINEILDEEQKQIFARRKELDFSYEIPKLSRFRVNVYLQKGTIAATIRPIPLHVPDLYTLNLPPAVEELAFRPRGLILVTGPAGSGKSTTLAAMIDLINRKRKCHIITIEDPIEYLHENKLSVIEQRELHVDTESFASALKHVVRQSPDVIMVGEMRDLETISTAITAAETGHLVLGTLHTIDATQSIHRIVDVFPPSQQSQIRIQFAGALQGIIAQQLLPKANKTGRIPAVEILISTPAIRNLIVNNDIHQIPLLIHTGKDVGMKTLNQSLRELYRKKLITYETAISCATNLNEFKRLIRSDLEKYKKRKGLRTIRFLKIVFKGKVSLLFKIRKYILAFYKKAASSGKFWGYS